jgi:hypothetical protein
MLNYSSINVDEYQLFNWDLFEKENLVKQTSDAADHL